MKLGDIIEPMSKSRRNFSFLLDDSMSSAKRRKVPHEFVLDKLSPLPIETRSMFGCLAVYVGDKIVLLLRDRADHTVDNGVWLATTKDHHDSLRKEFPNMRSIYVLGKDPTGWQVLPVSASDFEEAALHACELILGGDSRIGKIPKSRQRSRS